MNQNKAASGRVAMTLYKPGWVRFDPVDMPDERMADYRRATEGSRYVKEYKARLTPLDRALSIVVQLTREGFNVQKPDRELHHLLRRLPTQQWIDRESLNERIQRIDQEIFERKGERMRPYQRTGAIWLAKQISALLADEQGTGKEQPVSEPVLTPTGWRPIGDLRVGDKVIGSDGRHVTVTGVFPQGIRDVYCVTLSDGASTRCGLEHLWYVETHNDHVRKNRGRVLTLGEIMARGLRYAGLGQSRWYVPIPAPATFDSPTPEIDPYLLGALIANGCFVGALSHSGTAEQRTELSRVLPAELALRPVNDEDITYRIVSLTKPKRNDLVRWLRLNGFLGKRSWEKTIPTAFMLGVPESRRALLAGLMDNDGTVSGRDGTLEYNTTSPGLSKQVLELVRSLGGSAWMSTRVPKFTYKGEVREGRVDHRIRMAIDFNPFRVRSKAARYKPRTKYPPRRVISNIERVGREESVCIAVDAADHLYVTNDFIVTHNTLQVLAAIPPNVPVLVVCPTAAKGDWRSQRKWWRPSLDMYVVDEKHPYRHPRANEIVLVNYERLPDIHDRDGVKGRICDGFLPPKRCKGCKEIVRFLGKPGQPGTQVFQDRTGHTDKCKKRSQKIRADRNLPDTPEYAHLLKPEDCPGCHPILDSIPEGTIVVGDEAQYVKTFAAKRTKHFRAFGEVARSRGGRTWLSSGTPVENEAVELWNITKAAGAAETVFGSWDGFVSTFKGKKLRYGGYDWGEPGDEIKEKLQRFMLRRLIRDVLPEIPERTWGQHEVDLNPRRLREIDTLLRQEGQGRSIDEIAQLIELEEIPLKFMSKVRAALAAAKIPEMLEIVEDYEEKGIPLVVFSAHRAPIEMLEKREGWVVIHGGMTADEKSTAKDAFQNGYVAEPHEPHVVDQDGVRRLLKEGGLRGERVYPKGVGITIRAGGVSMTLTRANHMLFVDREWTPTANAQAESRCIRFGTTKAVIITTLVANHPLDVRVTEILIAKAKLIGASVDRARDDTQAPMTEAVLDAELREAQAAIAFGGKVRRMPETEEERAAFHALHELEFERKDERIVSDLAEDATTIGLTDAQWAFAIRLACRGKQPVAFDAAAAASPANIAHAESDSERAARAKALPAPVREWCAGGVGASDLPMNGVEQRVDNTAIAVEKSPLAGWPTRSLPRAPRLR